MPNPYLKRSYDEIVSKRVDVSNVYGLRSKIQLILDKHASYGAIKEKHVSKKTIALRSRVIHRCFSELQELGYKIRDPYNLGVKHIQALVSKWESEGKSAATLQTHFSHLRWFCTVMCKFGMLGSLDDYLKNKEAGKRIYAAQEDKSWEGNDIDVASLIEAVSSIDRVVGAQLLLMQAFGLRPKEAVMFKPAQCIQSDHVELFRRGSGTKGGRGRVIKIETDFQRQVLELIKPFASRANGSIAHAHLTLEQELRRFYYVLDKSGINRKDLGVTAYGLRHGFAHSTLIRNGEQIENPISMLADALRLQEILESRDESRHWELVQLVEEMRATRYVRLLVDNVDGLERLERARLITSGNLGHARLNITSAYTGSAKTMLAFANRVGKIFRTDYRSMSVKQIARHLNVSLKC